VERLQHVPCTSIRYSGVRWITTVPGAFSLVAGVPEPPAVVLARAASVVYVSDVYSSNLRFKKHQGVSSYSLELLLEVTDLQYYSAYSLESRDWSLHRFF
jgi:hypothetical protein